MQAWSGASQRRPAVGTPVAGGRQGGRVAGELSGKRIAFLATDGVEQVEYTEPRKALEGAGATCELVSPKSDSIKGFNHLEPADTFPVEVQLSEADPLTYDAMVQPGGVANPDFLRMDPRAVRFIRSFIDAGKPVGVICHGPWMLIEADAARGRTITSWPSLRTDLRNAGANWVDQEVVTDGNITTSRKPDDLPAFCAKLIQEFSRVAEPAKAQTQEQATRRM
jgi:protease I